MMTKTPLSYKMNRIQNGYSVSPDFSGYLIRSFAEMPVLSARAEKAHDNTLIKETLGKLKTAPAVPVNTITFGMLAAALIRMLEDGCGPEEKAFSELCKAYFFVLDKSDPSKYRRLQKKADNNDNVAIKALAECYNPGRKLLCEFLEVPFVEYRDFIFAAGLTEHDQQYITRFCRSSGIRGDMRLYDVLRTLKDGFERPRVPLIEFFVLPIACLMEDAHSGHSAENNNISNKRKEFYYEH